mgnify:CR=1 FL=1
MKGVIFFILLISQVSVWSQDTIPLSNNYPFKDGIYLSFEEFKGDNPTYKLGQFKIDEIDSTDYDLTKVKNLKVLNKKGKWKSIPIRKIWGICYQGIPYIYYRGNGNINSPFSNYDKLTRIDVIGTISMFRLELLSKTYNTNAFTNKTHQQPDVFILDMLLDMNSGKTHPFTYHSVKHYIKQDEDLFYELQIHKHEINLYDIVFAFNLRNPVFPSAVSYYEN